MFCLEPILLLAPQLRDCFACLWEGAVPQSYGVALLGGAHGKIWEELRLHDVWTETTVASEGDLPLAECGGGAGDQFSDGQQDWMKEGMWWERVVEDESTQVW